MRKHHRTDIINQLCWRFFFFLADSFIFFWSFFIQVSTQHKLQMLPQYMVRLNVIQNDDLNSSLNISDYDGLTSPGVGVLVRLVSKISPKDLSLSSNAVTFRLKPLKSVQFRLPTEIERTACEPNLKGLLIFTRIYSLSWQAAFPPRWNRKSVDSRFTKANASDQHKNTCSFLSKFQNSKSLCGSR